MSKKSHSHKSNTTKTRPVWLLPLIAVVIVVVVIGAVLLLNRTNQPTVSVDVSGKPNLVVDKTLIDFGNVRFENPVTAVFTVSNTGDKPLQILQEPRVELLQGC